MEEYNQNMAAIGIGAIFPIELKENFKVRLGGILFMETQN